jgi:tRNA-modifying protein YgfZ
MPATCLTSRAIVRLSPQNDAEDVAGFLQGLVTQDVTGALPVWSALLTPQGKVLFDFLVWPDARDLLIDCEADQADALAKRLSMYRLRRAISIVRDASLAVHWRAEPGGDPRLAALGTRWLAPAVEGEASAEPEWLAHRLSLGVCEGQAELADLLWLECNAAELNGVSFTKGCYVGQENTARMNWRQKVNRRLVVMPLAQSDPARQRVAYPDLGLAIDHLRVEDIAAPSCPEWMSLA